MQLLTAQTFARGHSFWRVVLTTGKTYCELDTVNDPIRGTRHLDWYLDICATGDTRRIAELWLHTPLGEVALRAVTPQTVYTFYVGVASLEERSRIAQVIGRVDDKDQGTGIAFIWDTAMQQTYKDEQASIRDFAAWRPGVSSIGALSAEALGVRL